MPIRSQARDTEVGQQLIDLLRELIVEELDAREARSKELGDYDEAACAALAEELGVNSLNRAADFFGKLALDGEADSLTMGVHLGVGSPRNISSAITTPVKRVTKRLGLELPWTEDENSEGRTVWRDRDGIAARMRGAVSAEQHRRATAT
jgi:hypothetical protein